jgi:hypothetical protein
MWVGHYSLYLLLCTVAVSIVSEATEWRYGVLVDLSAAGWIAWIASIYADAFHDRRLCERCIRDAPALGPERSVKRWKPLLWLFHRKLLFAIVFFLVCMNVGWAILGYKNEPRWQVLLGGLVLLSVALSWLTLFQHRRLQPWCPYCHWDEGGEEEASPVLPAHPVAR